jgi:hypothetical protein
MADERMDRGNYEPKDRKRLNEMDALPRRRPDVNGLNRSRACGYLKRSMVNRPDSVNPAVLSHEPCSDEWCADGVLASMTFWLGVRIFSDCSFFAASDTQAWTNLFHQAGAVHNG